MHASVAKTWEVLYHLKRIQKLLPWRQVLLQWESAAQTENGTKLLQYLVTLYYNITELVSKYKWTYYISILKKITPCYSSESFQ